PWLFRILIWPILKPVVIVRVNTFYPRKGVSSTTRKTSAQLIVTAAALAFGGIHCLGWSFIFPSSTERTLWRFASVSIVAVPILYLLLILALHQWDIEDFIGGVLLILLFPYMFGRLVLLILPFLCLRSLPPAAYYVVHWASFIPHVL
ncbi:hypothetical protein F5148DRAFT_1248780, partial [Russula earlei]